ncbi:unnamed protein product [Effrenium voratum]|nr:unnamed protein product [Effrenium voratum]
MGHLPDPGGHEHARAGKAPDQNRGYLIQRRGNIAFTNCEKAFEDLSKRGDAWYEEHLSRLGKDGLRCTKVGTNGKPYERFVYLDSRNLTLEIRGGRSGTSGVMMDDLVDIRQGLNSPDFEQLWAE